MDNSAGHYATAADAAIKASRQILRRILAHMEVTHFDLGVQPEAVGLVDVVYHPENHLPELNYVAPRRNTAWIPGPAVVKGMSRLREHQRPPRVIFIEELSLPVFAASLEALGLEISESVNLLACEPDDIAPASELPDGMDCKLVDTQEGAALWRYVRENPHFDVLTAGIEPLYVGDEVRASATAATTDIILSQNGFPVGGARLTTHNGTAHICALALMREGRTPERVAWLYGSALAAAVEHDCDLIFTTIQDENELTSAHEAGFLDAGTMVCYAEAIDESSEDEIDAGMAQPVLSLR